ncbi:Ig-like domain repeat protein [Cryobacterium sp. SO2]|uniref:Ig-like domain repeat protein n=1 Tax=Cryobacterium sp. SO2 TaxID=1897060 RepID=UPI00223E12B1|nr:Ig-like domain repeat protein [Cryobacterium sp. SO2]WEO76766.1 Ig-like domain repeat protein [Cryobacterium sp. SO2]
MSAVTFAGLPVPASASSPASVAAVAPAAPGDGPTDPLDDVVLVPGVTIPDGPVGGGPNARVATVVHTVWVSVVNATPATTDNVVTGLDSETNIRALIAKMNAFWAQESGGRVSVVFGGYEKRNLSGYCGLNDIYSRAAQAAFGGQFAQYAWVGSNDHLLVLARDGCSTGSSGLGSLGGDGGQMVSFDGATGSLALPTVLHEFGHNLGFSHATASMCRNSGTADGAVDSFVNGVCPVEDYADTLDIMGYTRENATPHLSSLKRISAGFLTDFSEITSGAGTRTTTILPLDSSGASGVRALRVVDPLTQEAYVVEFRTNAGADATSAEFTWPTQRVGPLAGGYYRLSSDTSRVTGGVRVLRELPFNWYPRTTVLATGVTPGSTDRKSRDTHLDAGETFSSLNDGFTLTVKSLNATSGAVVAVTFGKMAAAPVATSTTFDGTGWTGWTQTAGSTDTAQVRATIASANGRVPTGKVVFLDGTHTLATVSPDSGGVALYRLPSTLTAGTHILAAQFVPSTTASAPSRSDEQDLTVLPGPVASHTTLGVNRTSQVYGSATRITATAAVAKIAGVYPAGSVEFSTGGTVLGSVRLGATGTAAYTLPSTLGGGARSVTARFVPGTTTVKASASAAVAVTVAKATAKATISLVAPSVKTTKSAVVKVTITAPGVAKPTGTLSAYANGKLLKTYTLAAASAGKVSLTLPAFTTVGAKTITVRYSGSANIVAATSSGARLTVAK